MKNFKFLCGLALSFLLVAGSAFAIPYHKDGSVVDTQAGYTWSDSAYWTFTDLSTGYNGESTFQLIIEHAAYESGFGLFTVDDITNPTSITAKHEIFASDQEPSNTFPTEQSVYFKNTNGNWIVSNDINAAESDWQIFSNQFGFYFDVDAGNNGSVDYTYFSDWDFNTVDEGDQHVAVQYDGTSKVIIQLEDLRTEKADWDWEDMVVTGNDVAPVPEPATLFLLGFGLLGIAGIQRKKIKK